MANDDDRSPMLFTHCKNAYTAMFASSNHIGDQQVYEGTLTNLITRELNLSIPYYTTITRALRGMGCIRQLARGGGTAPSQWELLKEPTEEEFEKFKESGGIQKKGRVTPTDALKQQIKDMNDRLSRLENGYMELVQILRKEETDGNKL